MKKTVALLFFIVLFFNENQAQGYVLAIGGGTERSGTEAWNYKPYRWAVEKAANKRVAIIAYGAETDTW